MPINITLNSALQHIEEILEALPLLCLLAFSCVALVPPDQATELMGVQENGESSLED